MAAAIFNAVAQNVVPLTLANGVTALGGNSDKVLEPHDTWWKVACKALAVGMQLVAIVGAVYTQALPVMAKAVAYPAICFTAYMWLESDRFELPATVVKAMNLGLNIAALGATLLSATINPAILAVNAACLLMNAKNFVGHTQA